MEIETYFGFFSRAVFTAIAASLASQTGKPVALDGLSLSATNTLKLRWSEVDTVLVPALAERSEVDFVLALTARDAAALGDLARGRTSSQRMMEQAVAAALEPFNFVGKTRNKLTGLQFSRNVTGLTAHHLRGEVAYTMAIGRLATGGGHDLSLCLLVTAAGRDLVEARAAQAHTQRAIYSINQGAYVCRPQWEPPPPPPGMEKGTGLSAPLLNGWIQTFFALNDGAVPTRVFRRPAAQLSRVAGRDALHELQAQQDGVTVVRLVLNDDRAQEVIVLLPAAAEKSLMTLSKSGADKFLGDFFRVYFGEAAQLWGRFAGVPVRWRVQGVGRIPADGLKMVSSRLEGGGFVVHQEVRLDEGRVAWLLAVSPHAWRAMLVLTARAMGLEPEEPPDREAVFRATGWGGPGLPWPALLDFTAGQELHDVVRLLTQAKFQAPHMAAVTARLDEAARDRWLAALPVMLRERTEAWEPEEGEEGQGPRHEAELAETLIALNRARKLPEGRLADWFTLYAETVWARRQHLIDRLLPLRHFIYGMDRGSLSRLLFDEKGDVLRDLVCGAEFPVVDQIRRAISPGFAVRLLEDVAVWRGRATAFTVQEAQLRLYRRGYEGVSEGRYLMRPTPAQRLGEIMRWLDEPA